MGRIRIVLFAFGIGALTAIFALRGEFIHMDRLVRVTKATNLIGKQVTNLEGKNLGEIKDLVINWRSGGYVEYAVLSFGGFLGLGDKYFAVPCEAMVLSGDKEQFILNVKEDHLKKAPGFDKDKWPDMSRPEWAAGVYEFYDLDQDTPKFASRFSSSIHIP